MLHKLLLVFVVLSCITLQAQTIRSAEVYEGPGNQQAMQSIILPNGERYTLVTYDSSFTVDSLGTPITINMPPFAVNSLSDCKELALAVIKYDSLGTYQFHVMLHAYYSLTCADEIGFGNVKQFLAQTKLDTNNQLILCCTLSGIDSLIMVDAKLNKFKTLYTPINFDYTLSFLCKLNQNGQFLWVNTITRNKAKQSANGLGRYTRVAKSLTVNMNNMITIHMDLRDIYQPYIDTLTLTYTNGNTIPIYVNQNDMALSFNPNGSLSQQTSPFSLTKRKSADSLQILSAVSDGVFSYSLVRIELAANDTFQAPSPLPLLPGNNVVLVKTNTDMQVVWVKFICRGIGIGDSKYFHLDYFAPTQQLALGFTIAPATTVLGQNMVVPPANVYKAIVSKFNTSGELLWYDSYGINAILLLTFNTKTGGLILLGFNGVSVSIGSFYLQPIAGFVRDFAAFFDATSNQCTQLLSLHSSPNNRPKTMFDYTYIINSINYYEEWNGFYLGLPINDNKGRIFITGRYTDSLILPCKKYFNIGNTTDGVVLILDPTTTTKDTGVCKSMVSPSGKYTWSSNGLYRDTVLNSLGCDSVLLFKLTILKSQSVVDTNVCYQLVSPSGKYTYTTNGTYVDTIPNHKGCDSVITLKVQVLHRRDTFAINQCKPYLSPSGKYTYNISGQYLDTLKTTTGCDSVLLINFTRSFLGDTLTINKCKPYTSPSGKYTYNISGQYVDTLTTATGCDSVLLITFNRTFLGDTISVNRCKQYTSPSGKYTYNTSGQYWDTLQTNAGCDSVLLINFTTQQNGSTLTINTCNPYLTPSGKDTLTQSGTYTDTLTNQFNCDSIITIILTQQTFTVQATAGNEVSCDTPFTQLQATAAVSYRWSPPDYLSDTTSSNPIASPTQNITYMVTATNDIGCNSTDTINVVVKRVEKTYTLPNVFTPNGDGFNDCFPLVNESKLSRVSFTVYNRWGNEVFSTTNPNACWLGTDNHNNPVPIGVYYYVLTGQNNCGTPITTNGSIQVLR